MVGQVDNTRRFLWLSTCKGSEFRRIAEHCPRRALHSLVSHIPLLALSDGALPEAGEGGMEQIY